MCLGLLACAFLLFVGADTAVAQDPGPWIATLESTQGTVQKRLAGQTNWATVGQNETFLRGDAVRTLDYSRAAVLLPSNVSARLDQNSTLILVNPATQEPAVTEEPEQDDETRSILDIVTGIIHFISREPEALRVLTPFGNAGIEGTEFLVTVTAESAVFRVLEGTVAVTNAAGQRTAVSSQEVVAQTNQLSVAQTVIRPRDAVHWALYYVPVMSAESIGPDQQPSAVQAADAQFYARRAAARLAVGRVDEARTDIAETLSRDSQNVEGRSLESIIALTQNNNDEALRLANLAVAQDAGSSTALIALSYAQQAFFDISGALSSLQSAVANDPENALAWARLSELWLAIEAIEPARTAAARAVDLNADLARTQSVQGFSNLSEVRLDEAEQAFRAAIQLDEADPLPRLGLGLALIRKGEFEQGRTQLELAVVLDPGNSLIRSYMGKAYYEERRDDDAATQLEIAKELDPLDPTPWLYNAIRVQANNDPLDALTEIQTSVALNDNRAVYRSRLLLDEDLAARSASQGQIYRDLNFPQLALLQGWKSISSDPRNYSGHRLLADAYSNRPGHEVTRVNELFQSQLLQPLNLTPVQPQLSENSLFILDNAGPSEIAFNEFNPVFNRNRITAQGSGVIGGNNTRGGDITFAGISDRWSYSIGKFYFETAGFRLNNDLEQDIVNGIVQYRATAKTSLLLEYRSTERDHGDLQLLFDPSMFDPAGRQTAETDSLRVGVRHSFSSNSTILGSVVHQDATIFAGSPPFLSVDLALDGYTAEIQHLYQRDKFQLTSGVRVIRRDRNELTMLSLPVPFPPFQPDSSTALSSRDEHESSYVYATVSPVESLRFTLGVSAESLDGRALDKDRFNPKFGVIWEPAPGTTVRFAAFRTLEAVHFSRNPRQDLRPRLEPTQLGGFSQFFPDVEGQLSWRYGIGVDHKVSEKFYTGVELSERDLDVPVIFLGPPEQVFIIGAKEHAARAYAYWTPADRLAFNATYQFDKRKNEEGATFGQSAIEIRTHRIPISVSYFHPSGLRAQLTGTHVDQEGTFLLPTFPLPSISTDDDQFWVMDLSVGYRLPNRHGLVSLGVNNVLDEEFRFQDVDPERPLILPERIAFLRFSLSF